MKTLLLALTLLAMNNDGYELKIESDSDKIDLSASVYLTVELKVEKGKCAELPDLKERVSGFSLAEDYDEPEQECENGSILKVATWRLKPRVGANEYKIRPFAVADAFVTRPIVFRSPDPLPDAEGDMEIVARKVLPPLSLKLIASLLLVLAAFSLLIYSFVVLIRFMCRKLKEHRMSPIERAWLELALLLKKGLPGRGRYKDFYVELTMVLRRYIQRKYSIKAPNMTTEEFLREATPSEQLKEFLEAADMVKFAGVEATPEMADEATEAARTYLKSDALEVKK